MARERLIKVTVVGDESSLARAFGRAGKQAGVLQGKLGKLAGIAGVGGLIIGIKKAGEAVIGMAGSFEESLAKIVGLVGVNKDVVEDWGDTILQMAPKVGKSANELADALFFITSAGIRDSVEAMEVLEAAGKAAAAGLGETKDVAFAVVSAMNAYGPANLSAAEATDILVNTVRAGNLEASELAGSLGAIIPVASEFGVSFDEVGASVAAMTRMGANSSEAITNLTGIMKVLIKPTSQANEALAEMGLSAAGLRQQVREEGLLSVLGTLKSGLENNEEAFGKVFGRMQGMIGFLSLMGKNAETNAEIFADLANSTGTLDEAFAAASDTANFQFRQALAELQSAGIELGSEILPSLVEFVQEITPKLVELIPAFQELATAMIDLATGIADLIGPLIGPLATALRGAGLLMSELVRQTKEFAAAGGAGSVSMTRYARILHEIERQALSTGDSLEDAKRVVRILATEGKVTGDVLLALADDFGLTREEVEDIAIESRAWSSDLKGLDKELERVGITVDESTRADERHKQAIEDRAEAYARTPPVIEEAVEALEDHEEATEDDAEEVLNFRDALIEAQGAQESLTDVIKRSVDPVFNLVGEVTDYVELLEDVSEEGGITAEEQFKLAEAGFEVAAAFEAMDDPDKVLEALDTMAEGMGLTRDGVIELLAEFGIFVDEAGNISSDIADGLLSSFIGIGDRMAHQANLEIRGSIDQISRNLGIRSPSTVFADRIGRPMAEGIAKGILEGMDEARSALEELTDTLRKDAEDDLSTILASVGAVTGRRGARDRARRAKEDQAALKLEKEMLPLRLAAAQAAILAADGEDELEDAKEELADVNQRLLEIDQDLVDAADDVLDANLNLVQAQQRLVEVGNEMVGVSQEAEDAFARLAASAGLTTEEIGALVLTMQQAAQIGSNFAPVGVSGSGSTPTADPLTAGSAAVNALLATKAGSQARAAIVDEYHAIGILTKPDFWKNVVNPSQEVLGFLASNAARAGLARGGIATGPTRALLGEGGSSEAVIPLNDEGLEFLSQALRDAGGVGGNSIQMNVQTNADPKAIAFELGWMLKTGSR